MAAIHAAAFRAQRPWSAAEFTDLLAAPTTISATASGACFALAQAVAGEAELLTIATHPEHQRQGLARACLTNLLTQCAASGCTKMFLDVDEENQSAIALYTDLGFVTTATRRDYYAHPDGTRSDAILMQKEPLIVT